MCEPLCFQNHPPTHVSQEPGLSIQSLQVSTEAEQEGESSEERVSPSCDPERDPVLACRAGWEDLDKNHRTGRTKGHTGFLWHGGKPAHLVVKRASLEPYETPAVFLRSTLTLGVLTGTRAGADGVGDTPSLESPVTPILFPDLFLLFHSSV